MEFLNQKAKWLKNVDENTKLLHQSIKARKLHNHVYSIHDKKGTWHDNVESVAFAFLDYYQQLLGSNEASRRPPRGSPFGGSS